MIEWSSVGLQRHGDESQPSLELQTPAPESHEAIERCPIYEVSEEATDMRSQRRSERREAERGDCELVGE